MRGLDAISRGRMRIWKQEKKEEKKQIYEVIVLKHDGDYITMLTTDKYDESYERWKSLTSVWVEAIKDKTPFIITSPVVTAFDPGTVKEITVRPVMKVAESFRDWGRDCYCAPGENNTCHKRFDWKLGNLPQGYDHKYIYSEIGFNLKSTDLQAALVLSQLNHLTEFISRRKANFEYLHESLYQLEEFFILPKWDENAEPSWFGFPITLRGKLRGKRNDLIRFLAERKIDTRLIFAGNILKQPGRSLLQKN